MPEQFFLGISSGVLCVIFGIYDKLVESILGIFKNFKENFFYLLPFASGGFIGIFLLGKALSFLLNTYPMQTKYTFIGLILGSMPLLLKKINSVQRFRIHYSLYTIVAFIIGLFTVILEKNISSNVLNQNSNLMDMLFLNQLPTFLPILLLFVSGFFMSIGIVVPGVSSTLILMCFGIYDIYLQAISTMNLTILIPLGIGVLVGGIIVLKIIKYLLDNYYMQTFYSIIGFTLGSVLILYVPLSFDFTGFVSILLLILSFYIAGLFEKENAKIEK